MAGGSVAARARVEASGRYVNARHRQLGFDGHGRGQKTSMYVQRRIPPRRPPRPRLSPQPPCAPQTNLRVSAPTGPRVCPGQRALPTTLPSTQYAADRTSSRAVIPTRSEHA
ncbi:hypothetical protein AcV5_001840 [Taiwanofungus camphoratus]|nr:hypothetical protein AcV5_001840 [Antrodia cinnamomea]